MRIWLDLAIQRSEVFPQLGSLPKDDRVINALTLRRESVPSMMFHDSNKRADLTSLVFLHFQCRYGPAMPVTVCSFNPYEVATLKDNILVSWTVKEPRRNCLQKTHTPKVHRDRQALARPHPRSHQQNPTPRSQADSKPHPPYSNRHQESPISKSPRRSYQ